MSDKLFEDDSKSPFLPSNQGSCISGNDSEYELIEECSGSSDMDDQEESNVSPKVPSKECLEVSLKYPPPVSNTSIITIGDERNLPVLDTFHESSENMDSQGYPLDDVLMCDNLGSPEVPSKKCLDVSPIYPHPVLSTSIITIGDEHNLPVLDTFHESSENMDSQGYPLDDVLMCDNLGSPEVPSKKCLDVSPIYPHPVLSTSFITIGDEHNLPVLDTFHESSENMDSQGYPLDDVLMCDNLGSPEVPSKKCLDVSPIYPHPVLSTSIITIGDEHNLPVLDTFHESSENMDSQGYPLDDVLMCDNLGSPEVPSKKCLDVSPIYPHPVLSTSIITIGDEHNLPVLDTFHESSENMDSQGYPLDDVLMCDNLGSPEVPSKKCLDVSPIYPHPVLSTSIITIGDEHNLPVLDTFHESSENMDSQGYPLDDVLMCDNLVSPGVPSKECLDVSLLYPHTVSNTSTIAIGDEKNLSALDTFPESSENTDSQGYPLDDVLMCDSLVSPDVPSEECLEVSLLYPHHMLNTSIITSGDEKDSPTLETFSASTENIDSQGYPLDDILMCDNLVCKMDQYRHGNIEDSNKSKIESARTAENLGIGEREVSDTNPIKDKKENSGKDKTSVECKENLMNYDTHTSAQKTDNNKMYISGNTRVYSKDEILIPSKDGKDVMFKDNTVSETLDSTCIHMDVEKESNMETDKKGENNDIFEPPKVYAEMEARVSVKLGTSGNAEIEAKGNAKMVTRGDADMGVVVDTEMKDYVNIKRKATGDIGIDTKSKGHVEARNLINTEATGEGKEKFRQAKARRIDTTNSHVIARNLVNTEAMGEGKEKSRDAKARRIDTTNSHVKAKNLLNTEAMGELKTKTKDRTEARVTTNTKARRIDDTTNILAKVRNLIRIASEGKKKTQGRKEAEARDDTIAIARRRSNKEAKINTKLGDLKQPNKRVIKGEAHKFYKKVAKGKKRKLAKELDIDQINLHWESLCAQKSTKHKEEFFRSSILNDSDGNFFNVLGALLKKDSRIMSYLEYLLDLILKDCAQSGNPNALLASASIIYGFLLNPKCKLTLKQRIDLSEYSILMFLQQMDKGTSDILFQRIPLVLEELIKINGDVNEVCFCAMINLLRSILVKEDIDCRIMCGLLDTLISMGSGALFYLIPKCFSNLCKVIDETQSMLQKQNPKHFNFSPSKDGVAIFMNKMDEVNSSVRLYWKLCDVCGILLTNFFKENFTIEGIEKTLYGLSQGETQLTYKSLEPFFVSCLSYFGDTLTFRLSETLTPSSCTHFLRALYHNDSLLVHNNQIMDVGTLLRSTILEKELESKTQLKRYPFALKVDQEQGNEKFKNLELRCGLINASRLDENKVSDQSPLMGITPRTLKNAEILEVPDYANTTLLDYLSAKAGGRYKPSKHWEPPSVYSNVSLIDYQHQLV